MNKVILIGNLGQDPVEKKTENSTLCKFSVATTKRMQDTEETTWHNCQTWGKTAELCAKYLSKGSKVCVEGEITKRKYTDKDGNERESFDINVHAVEFLSKAAAKSEEFETNDNF